MIPLIRERSTTAILPKYRGAKRAEYNLSLLNQQQELLQGVRNKFDFVKMWGEAKAQLMREAHYKCAYCEKLTDKTDNQIKESSFADVEHYRPKSLYWWLAYCYENYLYACEICNRTYKNDKFPIQNTGQTPPNLTVLDLDNAKFLTPDSLTEHEGQSWSDFEEKHHEERPFILQPYFDIPANFFGYEVDGILKEVKMFVLPHIPNAIQYQNAIDNDLGLNREFLRTDRYTHYNHYNLYKEVLLLNILPFDIENKYLQQIQEMQQPHYPYSGMIHYFESL